jgi:ribosomal protein S18 acetylase RimI-like enzyme
MAKFMATRNSTLESVQNGIAIVRNATKLGLSLSEASRQAGFGRNYVSDVKARLKANREARNIDATTASEFRKAIKTYEKSL